MDKKILSGAFIIVCAFTMNSLMATPSHAEKSKKIDALFIKLDNDRDGKISKAEAEKKGNLKTHFSEIDSNGDSYLSRDELSNYHKNHKGKNKSGKRK